MSVRAQAGRGGAGEIEPAPTGAPEGAVPALAVEGLSLAFGGVRALTKVGFEARPGSITSIIGPNGAGKTSLFNSISGFYRPHEGTVRLFGETIDRVPAPRRAALGLARTFQNIALFRGMTVLDNIKLGRHAHLRTSLLDALLYLGRARREEAELRAEIEERVIDLLEIDHIRHAPVAALPYGLRKRVELARALAMRPRVLMLDEPVAGMNREETEDMARFILDVREEWGVTVLMVEHDMGMVMDVSDHVVVLNFGQVIASGRPEEVQRDPDVIAAYLGSGDLAEIRRRVRGPDAGTPDASPDVPGAGEAA
jgi:branched-chain amino acid transport system ATP-binding protein